MEQKSSGKNFELILLALFTCILLVFVQGAAPVQHAVGAQGYVVVYLGNEVYAKVPLGEEQVLRIEQDSGEVNEVAITAQGVHMGHSSCENQDCVKQGEATLENIESRPLGGWIICLPNRVSIELVAEEPA